MDNDKDNLEKSNEHEISSQDESSTSNSEEEPGNKERLTDDSGNEVMNHWVKEIPDEPEIDDEDIVESLDNVSVNKGDLPDWINELSPADQEIFDSEKDAAEGDENLESIQLDTPDVSLDAEDEMDEDQDDDEFSAVKTESLEEGFVEISEYNLDAIEEIDDESSLNQESTDKEEELPDWLEDMIVEEQQPAFEEEEKQDDERIFMSDEPTKPVPIIEEGEPEDYQEQAIEETPSIANLYLDEIELEETEPQVGESIHIVEFEEETDIEEQELYEVFPEQTGQEITEFPDEEEAAELIEGKQDYEDMEAHGEDWEIYDRQPVEIPKTLRFAKYLLDQGEIDPADQIFQTYIAKADYLDEIKTWVTDAVSEGKSSQSKLWEILGDIAVKQSEHAEALSAYTQSISVLLKNQ